MLKHRLLLVDDSEFIIKALKRVMRDEGYEIFSANSAKEALEILSTKEIDLIISDQNMPEVSGTELFKLVKIKYPQIIRIMLTGVTDFDVIKDAINKGEIYRYFNKPFDDFELMISVRYALRQKELELENQSLKEKLEAKENYLKQLEMEYPGITQKKVASDGAIIIDGNN